MPAIFFISFCVAKHTGFLELFFKDFFFLKIFHDFILLIYILLITSENLPFWQIISNFCKNDALPCLFEAFTFQLQETA